MAIWHGSQKPSIMLPPTLSVDAISTYDLIPLVYSFTRFGFGLNKQGNKESFEFFYW